MGEFANIHESAIGKGFPVVLGLNNITGDAAGAVEAWYVDTATFEYLAAGFHLESVDQVYVNNVLKSTPAHYSVVYADGDRTYIDFTSNQGDAKVTYNATGYSYVGWDSTNGYVQNPAYLISYFLVSVMGIPESDLNIDSFDTLATIYSDAGWGEAGRLIVNDVRSPESVLQELLWTFGAKMYILADGRINVGRKDISNFATTVWLRDQIDALSNPITRENLQEYVNHSNSRYDFYPISGQWKGVEEGSNDVSIADFGSTRDPSTPWDFPWTTSLTLVQQRLQEELAKAAYGRKKVQAEVPFSQYEDYDVFTNFRREDVFAPSATGGGESGRYFFVESMDLDPINNKIGITAPDLSWLLQAYCLLGDEDALASNWSAATPSDKMFCYACDETDDEFDNGEEGKQLIDENAI